MHLSVVIPATDGAATLERCLQAISACPDGPDEVIVVRGGQTPPAGVVAVHSPAHGGPSAARNAGVAIASGDVIVFVDADVVVAPDVFARIRARFAADARLDALFGAYGDTPGAPGVVSGFRNLLHHYVHRHGAGPAETFWTGLGAIRRDVLLAVGGLDDGLRYLEDLELGRRLVERGASILLDPEIQGTHLKTYTLRAMLRTDLRERSMPWVRLALEGRASRSALNAGGRHRASALVSVAVACGLLTRAPRAVAAASASMLVLNHDFYALLGRRLGARGALLGPALHVVHHLTALAGILPAVVQHLRSAPREPRLMDPSVLRVAHRETLDPNAGRRRPAAPPAAAPAAGDGAGQTAGVARR